MLILQRAGECAVSDRDLKRELLLSAVKSDAANGTAVAETMLRRDYPELSDSQRHELAQTLADAMKTDAAERVSLVVTAPSTFAIRARPTKITVQQMIRNASSSILITGYSLSDYFSDLVDEIIQKSQRGIFVRFFVNDIEHQTGFDRVLRYKGRFLKVYNYPKQQDDKMAALHAKVISVDKRETLITSANLSYHGQEGNLELGTYTESPVVARQLDDVFTQLFFKKVFVEV